MARRPFARTAADIAIDENGRPQPGRDDSNNVNVSFTAWTAETGGSQITDLQTASGVAISQGVIIPEQNGRLIQFLGPNDGTGTMWLDGGSGRFKINTTDLPGRVAALEAGGGGGGGSSSGPPPATAVVYSSTFRTSAPATNAGAFSWTCDGAGDQTEIQAAIDAVFNEGGGSVLLLGSDFLISGSIKMRTGVWLRGEGYGTEIKAASNFQAGMVVLFDQDVHATHLSNMTLNGNGQQVHGIHYNNTLVAETTSTLYNTAPATRPDSMHVVEHIFVLNPGDATFAGHGMIIEGPGSRAGRYGNMRILSASGCGVWLKGSVDSHYHMIEVGSSGSGGPTPSTSSSAPVGHGFYISQGDSCMFTNLKTWYSRGAGFYIRGTRGQYSVLQAQDNYGPGLWIAFADNSMSSVQADSNGRGAGANGYPQAGIYITTSGTQIMGFSAYDRHTDAGDKTQDYGMQINSACKDSILFGSTYGNSTGSVSGTFDASNTVTIKAGTGGRPF